MAQVRPGRGAVLRTSLAAALVGLMLASCSQAQLYTGLTEKEANEMVAVVQAAGFSATKTTTDNGKTWTLTAPKNQFPQEVALLQARGYPRERYESLGEVFKKQGFVSSPTEEHARFTYGLQQELAKTLTDIDGVVDARVHIAIPESDPLSDQVKPTSASVFIKYDPSVDLNSQVGSIKALVVNGVEGLPYDKVTVVLSPVKAIPMAGRPPAAFPIGAPLIGGVAILGGLSGFALWRLQRRRKGAGREVVA